MYALLTALALAGLLRVLWQIIRIPMNRSISNKSLYNYPLIPAHWFWGSFASTVKHKDRRLDYFHETMVENKTNTIGVLPPLFKQGGLLITEDPVLVQHILKDHFDVWTKTLGDDPPIDPLVELMGAGIFVIDHGPHAPDQGTAWLQQRKLASHIFTMHNFREYFEGVFVANGHRLLDTLKSQEGQTVDLQDWFFRYTMDSFGEIGFGIDFGTLKGQSNAYAEAFDAAHACILPLALEEGVKALAIEAFLPFPLNKVGLQIFRRTNKVFRRFTRQCHELDAYSYPLIAQRRSDPNLQDKNDLLSLFVKSRDEEGNELSDRFLRDIILNFLIAGRDTTACTLSWTFYELAQRPGVLAKLREELEEGLRGGEPSYEILKRLPYLHGVIYETLRLHPPVPLDFKMAAVDDVLPDGTHVKQGTRVAFFPYGMGRSEQLWEKPEEFLPERWALGETKDQYAFPVFQAGRRVCLGLAMAVFEAKTVTAMLAMKFDIELAPQPPINYSRTLTMSIKDGLKVNLKPREVVV